MNFYRFVYYGGGGNLQKLRVKVVHRLREYVEVKGIALPHQEMHLSQ